MSKCPICGAFPAPDLMIGLRSVFWDGREIPFERRDCVVFAVLVRHIGQCIPAEYFAATRTRVQVSIHRIRRLLRCEKIPFDIETIHTVGYKFVRLEVPRDH